MGREISAYFNQFEHYLRFEKRCSPHTIVSYKNDLRQFDAFLNHDEYKQGVSLYTLDSTLHLQVRLWMAAMRESGVAARSINRKLSSVSSYFKYLMRYDIVVANPVDLVHPLKVPKRLPQFLRESEMTTLFDMIDEADDLKSCTHYLIIELLYTCGLRRAELVGLKDTDVDFYGRQIRVLGKGNKERIVPVGVVVIERIAAYIELKKNAALVASTALLVLESGKPIYAEYVYRVVKQYLGAVSSLKKRSPHILRHTFASHLLNNGASIQAIKELLGHSSIAATQVYTHINIEELKKIHKLNHPRG